MNFRMRNRNWEEKMKERVITAFLPGNYSFSILKIYFVEKISALWPEIESGEPVSSTGKVAHTGESGRWTLQPKQQHIRNGAGGSRMGEWARTMGSTPRKVEFTGRPMKRKNLSLWCHWADFGTGVDRLNPIQLSHPPGDSFSCGTNGGDNLKCHRVNSNKLVVAYVKREVDAMVGKEKNSTIVPH